MSPAEIPPGEGPEDTDAVLAAEYVLRLLDPGAAAACVAREARDPGFAAEVARWRHDLADLDAAFAPAAPPTALRERVEAELFGRPPPLLARLWASAALWRAVAAAALLAVGLALVLPRAGPTPAPAPLVAAVQPAPGGDVTLVALYTPGSPTVEFRRLQGTAAPGRDLELWVLPEGETVPASLGVVPGDARFSATLPAAVSGRVSEGTAILVSDEPAGGSPTGLPTGAVVASGAVGTL